MTEIKIYRSLDKVLEIVYTLRRQGLQQGVDFDFTWVPEITTDFIMKKHIKNTLFLHSTTKNLL